jgi:hypothetical protein
MDSWDLYAFLFSFIEVAFKSSFSLLLRSTTLELSGAAKRRRLE